jgi:digeranylgeranylglycerophospholipid reductase
MNYDVVIVGAGPAGLMAARAVNNKLNYLLIDSKKEIGEPLRCAEGLREKTLKKLFGSSDFDFCENKVKKSKIICGNVERTIVSDFVELDRVKFEKWLAEPLKNIQLETKCEDVIVKKDYAIVKTNKGDIKSNLVILCHGTDYTIQKKYGMIKEDVTLAIGIGGLYKNYDKDKDQFYFYFDNDYLGGFWVFPKYEDKANIGYLCYEKDTNLKESFNHLIKRFGYEKAELIKSYGGILPVTGPIHKTYSDRIIVCGNAAGHVHAGTGEGIPFALEGGKIAGEIALEAKEKNNYLSDLLKNYEKRWKKYFGDQLEAGIYFSYLIAAGYKYDAYDKLFAVPTDKEIKEFILDGIIPKRAKLAIKLMKIFFKNKIKQRDVKKEPVPKFIKRIYHNYNKLQK